MTRFKLIIATLFVFFSISAQDLSKIDLSKLTPEQMEMYKKYMASKGGATATTNQLSNDAGQFETRKVVFSDSIQQTLPKNNDTTFFGSYLFTTQNLTFEPKLNIPTPVNYVIGSADEILVDVSGLYEANYKLKVSPEGTIRIPNVGPVKVSGKTIEDAARNIKNEVSKVYQGVGSGETRINITLGNIRSIRVTIIGDVVRPGTYTLPSLATAFNALYACGGPTEKGTMRNVRVIRNGKQIAVIDVYKFLIDGISQNNVLLHDEDVIKIDPYKMRVSVRGAVKHSGRFEVAENESLSELIRYAGGFNDDAYTQMTTVVRFADNQKKVIDVTQTEYKNFKVKAGDDFYFSANTDKFKNRIEIVGSINRPGLYALETCATVRQLIEKAAGLKEDAFMNMAVITRKQANQVPENINFNLGDVLNGKSADIQLQRDDKIEIKSLFEYREGFNVSISGEVKSPGTFPLIENLTLMDLILKARGFKEGASTDSVEVIRIIKDKNLLLADNLKTIVRKFKIDKQLDMNNSDGKFVLENGDQVVVRRLSGFEQIRMVKIEGEVLRPGDYNITSKTEYISDLVKRAGGFTKFAYPTGAFLIRNQQFDNAQLKLNNFLSQTAKNQIQKTTSTDIDASLLQQVGLNSVKGVSAIDSLQQKLNGTEIIGEIEKTEGLVGINLNQIMRNPRGYNDLTLEEGDVVYIPRELQTVRVMGEVFFPTYVRYDKTSCLKKYLNSAGGVSKKALKSKIFVLYPNGTSKSTRSFLGIRFYPRVLPGTQILVPQKQIDISQKMTPGETISVMSSVTSVAALVYSIVSNTLNSQSAQ